jgi:hydrogenase maturation protein HypF
MLPYTALHVLLMEELGFPVVATSGNLSDEPICTEAAEAVTRLGGVADLLLVHDRPIARPVDDSVVRVIAGEPAVLRAARGYAPLAVAVEPELPPVLALGGHLKNTVAVGRGTQIVLSQHVGDLETELSRQVFARTQAAMTELYTLTPDAAACDLHPDYASTRAAAQWGGRVIGVQHHYAHVLSAMAESRARPPVLGVAWDGTGYGPDGTVWGGEFLRVTESGFTRVARLRCFGLPGGEVAVREPRRAALGLLFEIFGDAVFLRDDLAPIRACSPEERRIFAVMLRSGVNTPRTSSAGRLFDAVASLLGLAQRVSYEGQAAATVEDLGAEALEHISAITTDQAPDSGAGVAPYPFAIRPGADGVREIDWQEMIEALVADLEQATAPGVIAARFHGTLADMIAGVAREVGEPTVILTGGCFQNALLTALASARLTQAGHQVIRHRRVPANDGGLAVGQALAAARGRCP